MLYIVRHAHRGCDVVSPPVSGRLAMETAIALAAAGRQVTVVDEAGGAIDVEDLADAVIRSAQA